MKRVRWRWEWEGGRGEGGIGGAARLGLGERAVRGEDEEDEVAPRHELLRQALLPVHDHVRAGRVDDVELSQQRTRYPSLKEPVLRLRAGVWLGCG